MMNDARFSVLKQVKMNNSKNTSRLFIINYSSLIIEYSCFTNIQN